jgi:uncharacterized protein YndB with AHSA1/START domain
MEANTPLKITITATVNANPEKVWAFWTQPEHITQWSNASPDWHTPFAENDLTVGGKFKSRMEAKDGSMGFDFGGVYDEVVLHQLISYTIEDGRKVRITFANTGMETEITEVFEAENENPADMQQAGWQTILNNFKSYVESH